MNEGFANREREREREREAGREVIETQTQTQQKLASELFVALGEAIKSNCQ